MKKWLIIFVLPATAFAVYSMVWLDGNNWLCPFYNDARWALDITVGTGEAGGSWPSPLLNKYMFGAGTWIGCVAGTDTLVSMGYNPNSGRTEMFPTLVRYWREGSADSADRVYKYPGDWPPPAGRFPMAPQDPVGDMTLWSCCCDSDPSSHIAPGRPLGLDLCLTVFLYEAARAQDFFFLEYELTNSSGSRHDSLIFGILCDHDVGAHADDMVGLILDDSFHVGGRDIRVTNTGFGYDYDNIEVRNSRNQWERGTPGAVAVRLLDGPNGLGLTAFKKFTIGINPTTDPDQYLTLAGYDYRTGVYAPFDSIDAAPDDKRFLLASGPFPLEPDSTARFVYAVIGSPFGDSGEIGPKSDSSELALRCFLAESVYQRLLAAQEPASGFQPAGRLAVAPNPFNNNALVHWSLERDAEVRLQVFDPSGRVVRTLAHGRHAAGTYTTKWNGRDDDGTELARGIYFVRLKTPSEMIKTKTILAR